METHIFNVWLFVRPSIDLPGQWEAHCLDFDVISQGSSIAHALSMVCEASEMFAVHELEHGRDPRASRAPQECFEELYDLIETGIHLTKDKAEDALSEEGEATVACLATSVELMFVSLEEPKVRPIMSIAKKKPPVDLAPASC